MRNIIELNWEMVGAKLASSSDEEQAKFFDGFAKELDTFESNLGKNTQAYMINRKLSESSKKNIKRIFP